MHFGENQLSQSLIGLSPLPTAHPPSFQPRWVRASTTSYSRFTLAMGRSLRFGSRPSDSNALFRLAFATATPHGLTSPPSTNSQAHSSKGTPSPDQSPALTDCRHMVSGTLSLPSRGTFHHSLTVLLHYRSTGSIQAYQVVLADSHTIPRAACYSRTHHRPAERITATGLTPSPVKDSTLFAYTPAPQPPEPVDPGRMVSQPLQRNPHRVSHATGLAPSAFARHYSPNHNCFLFLQVLRCFTSLRSPHRPYTFRPG